MSETMTPEEFAHAEPVDGAVVHWWEFLILSESIYLTERKAIYHEYMTWGEHPWSDGERSAGADFNTQWALWRREDGGSWCGSGRTESKKGWLGLMLQAEAFPSRRAAVKACKARLRRSLVQAQNRVRWLQESLLGLSEGGAP